MVDPEVAVVELLSLLRQGKRRVHGIVFFSVVLFKDGITI